MYNQLAKDAMDRLSQRLDPDVVETCAKEIIRLGPEALRLLMTFPDPLVFPASRHWIVKVALRMPRDEAVPVLLEGLSHPDWRIYQISRDAFSKMGAEARDVLVKSLETCTIAGGRIQTLYCLHRLADPYGPLALGDSSLIAPIAHVAESDESAEVRAHAIEVLSRSEAQAASGVIVKALADPSEEVRIAAAVAAGRLRLADAVPGLIQMLKHADAEVRSDVIYALDRIGKASAAPAVREMLNDAHWHVRWCAVKALECLWAPENAAALKMAAGDENPMVRIAAAEALALKAPDKAKDVLGRAAKSTHSGERESALFYART